LVGTVDCSVVTGGVAIAGVVITGVVPDGAVLVGDVAVGLVGSAEAIQASITSTAIARARRIAVILLVLKRQKEKCELCKMQKGS
jgi:hypothetical protein